MEGFDQPMTVFKTDVCTNDQHIIAKMYKILLKFDIEEEQVKECMIQWLKRLLYSDGSMGTSMAEISKIHFKF